METVNTESNVATSTDQCTSKNPSVDSEWISRGVKVELSFRGSVSGWVGQ